MPPRSRTKPGSTNRRPKVAGLRQHAHAGAAGPGVDDDDLDTLEDSVTEAPAATETSETPRDAAPGAPRETEDATSASATADTTEAPAADAADVTDTTALPMGATEPAEGADAAGDTATTAASTTSAVTAESPSPTAPGEPTAVTDAADTTDTTDAADTTGASGATATTDVDDATETTDDASAEAATAGTASTATRAGKVRRGSGMAPRASAPTTERPRRAADDIAASPTRTARPVRTGGRKTEPEAAPSRLDGVRERLRTFGDSRALPVTLVAVIVVCLVLAGLAFWQGRQAWTSGPVSNQATVDVGGTAELVGQSRESIEKIFSYDFSKLDDSVDAARQMSTGQFTDRYLSVFDQTIRQPAQQQQLRQTATVVNIGVVSMNGDRAEVMALTQFSAQRTTTGQSTNAPGLLRLQMERVDGRWKLAELTPLTANR
ncbi:hypothetical protein [Actinomycetospora sp. NBRC 106375]|uniref:hypothetical protein n=1 Tax=Actinomycetospora sp. NBRC 106375 TaxID=3032207 RepID=UPI0025553F07|nr:hypothetical protein [Actinomycetospora sp. NBRC 106375]